MGRILSALVLSVFLVACGGGGEDAEPTETTAVATTEAAAEETEPPPVDEVEPISTEQAAARYLELVRESNCLGQRFYDAFEPFEGLEASEEAWPPIQETVQPVARELSDAYIRFYEGLVTSEWPEDVQGDIDELVGQLTTEAQQLSTVADADSLDVFVSSMWALEQRDNVAGSLRAKLGLPPNFGDESDPCADPV